MNVRRGHVAVAAASLAAALAATVWISFQPLHSPGRALRPRPRADDPRWFTPIPMPLDNGGVLLVTEVVPGGAGPFSPAVVLGTSPDSAMVSLDDFRMQRFAEPAFLHAGHRIAVLARGFYLIDPSKPKGMETMVWQAITSEDGGRTWFRSERILEVSDHATLERWAFEGGEIAITFRVPSRDARAQYHRPNPILSWVGVDTSSARFSDVKEGLYTVRSRDFGRSPWADPEPVAK